MYVSFQHIWVFVWPQAAIFTLHVIKNSIESTLGLGSATISVTDMFYLRVCYLWQGECKVRLMGWRSLLGEMWVHFYSKGFILHGALVENNEVRRKKSLSLRYVQVIQNAFSLHPDDKNIAILFFVIQNYVSIVV